MIVAMKRLTLIALKSDQERLLEALQSLAAVQILYREAESEAADGQTLQQLENQVQRLYGAQNLLKNLAPKGKPGPKPLLKAEMLEGEIPKAMELCERVEETDRKIHALQSERDKKAGLVSALLPWETMDVPLEELQDTRASRVLPGLIEEKDLESLKELPCIVEVYGGEKEKAVLLFFHAEDAPLLTEGLRKTSFSEFSFPLAKGRVRENLTRLEAEMEASRKEEEALREKLRELALSRDLLCRAYDGAVILRDREAGKCALGSTETSFHLEGWVREDALDAVDRAIQSVTDCFYRDYRDPEEGEVPPVVLKNGKLTEPYEAVTNLYALPAPGSIDATPFFAPFYFLFFGMMLSDTGYGIVLALGCWLFLKLLKPQGMLGQIVKVLLMGGISTVVMGLLFGSFFGITWPEIFAGTALAKIFPLIDSSADPMKMLFLCAGLGLVHMFFGVFIAVYMRIRQGDYVAALVDNLSWFFLVIGLLLLAAPMIGLPAFLSTLGKILSVLSALVILLFAGRAGKSLGTKLAQGAFALYGITSWLGDVLSYARIFALGLSTGVIGLVLNTLGGMLNNAFQHGLILQIIGFILTAVMLVLLHGFMMAINCLGCFVHTARLQYVEFFGKFYEAGGRPFKPLKYNTRFVRTEE